MKSSLESLVSGRTWDDVRDEVEWQDAARPHFDAKTCMTGVLDAFQVSPASAECSGSEFSDSPNVEADTSGISTLQQMIRFMRQPEASPEGADHPEAVHSSDAACVVGDASVVQGVDPVSPVKNRLDESPWSSGSSNGRLGCHRDAPESAPRRPITEIPREEDRLKAAGDSELDRASLMVVPPLSPRDKSPSPPKEIAKSFGQREKHDNLQFSVLPSDSFSEHLGVSQVRNDLTQADCVGQFEGSPQDSPCRKRSPSPRGHCLGIGKVVDSPPVTPCAKRTRTSFPKSLSSVSVPERSLGRVPSTPEAVPNTKRDVTPSPWFRQAELAPWLVGTPGCELLSSSTLCSLIQSASRMVADIWQRSGNQGARVLILVPSKHLRSWSDAVKTWTCAGVLSSLPTRTLACGAWIAENLRHTGEPGVCVAGGTASSTGFLELIGLESSTKTRGRRAPVRQKRGKKVWADDDDSSNEGSLVRLEASPRPWDLVIVDSSGESLLWDAARVKADISGALGAVAPREWLLLNGASEDR